MLVSDFLKSLGRLFIEGEAFVDLIMFKHHFEAASDELEVISLINHSDVDMVPEFLGNQEAGIRHTDNDHALVLDVLLSWCLVSHLMILLIIDFKL